MTSKDRARNAIVGVIGQCKPGYFAMVMATGIVSIACRHQGMTGVSMLLFHFNVVVYAALWATMLVRYLASGSVFWDELADYSSGPGHFTVVAGTSVLGAQFALLTGDYRIAAALWFLAAILWVLLVYAFLAAITVRRVKAGLAEKINGEWLLLVVSTQSVSVLGSLAVPSMAAAKEAFLFIALCFFLVGSMLYILVITAILYRLLFISLAPGDLVPSYWIGMGAAAISTLAGATLVLESQDWKFLADLVPVLTGGSLFFWAIAGWWIPLLIILGAWSHLGMRAPLAKVSGYWSLVFPMGMYSACTFQLHAVNGLPFLPAISQVFNYVALLAWLITFLAALRRGIGFITRHFSGNRPASG